MKLVLLPGMDGTGMLFEPLLTELTELDVEVIALPSFGAQDYDSLAALVAKLIGERECVVLAESFSGGIAERLVRNEGLNIKHVIFVASFLSCPSRILSRLTIALPIKFLLGLPLISPLVLKALMLGWSANAKTISLLRKALKSVDSRILNIRIRHIAEYRFAALPSEVGATYIYPTGDLLVGNRSKEFTAAFPKLNIISVAGPHFVLQAEPVACAQAILATVGHLTRKT